MAQAARQIRYLSKPEARRTRELKSTRVDDTVKRLHKKLGRLPLGAELLDDSRPASAPLHGWFEWDDHKAAEIQRLETANRMISTSMYVAQIIEQRDGEVTIVESNEVRKFIVPFRGQGFRLRKDAFAKVDERRVFIERKLGVLRGWVRETCDLPELATVRAKVAEALKEAERSMSE